MHVKQLTLIGLTLIFTSCASLDRPGETLGTLPTVKFGDKTPADGQYILHFPSGVPIDTPVSFGGNLFTAEDREILTVIPRQDLYVHKQWISHDRKTWHKAGEVLKTDLQVVLPGYHHPSTGYLNLRLDRIR